MAVFTKDHLSLKIAFYANKDLRRRYRISLADGRALRGRPRLVRMEDPFFVLLLESGGMLSIDLDKVFDYALEASEP